MEKIIVTVDWLNNYAAGTDILPVVATHQTLEGLKEGFTESFNLHLQSMIEDNDEIPTVLQTEFELHFVLTTRALLHYYDNILSRAAISRLTGINEKQLGHYIQGVRNPRMQQREKIVAGLHKLGRTLIEVE
ncbi:hypothetical protein DW083_14255 [Parabacteroides sp. AF48-14]|jgi:hypothetical protein|uniref:hypothetical protein n=1 Tax=Parabacteroides sp. AF48-14 TaxID=2292052 RepID=UPI000EFEF33D|nr:hypothetical protein [Parabacteroides sp. AF48-14]RHO70118.1 hypothetical protein DW083_14255 [Parabacteroides sp. AF48-14]